MKHKCPMCSYYGKGEVYKFCKNCDSAREIGVNAGLERAAEMVETWANGNTPITVDEIAAAIHKEKK